MQKRELKEARWSEALYALMTGAKKTDADAIAAPKGAKWKINPASKLRQKEGASIVWIAENLHLGKPGAVRTYLSRGSEKPKN